MHSRHVGLKAIVTNFGGVILGILGGEFGNCCALRFRSWRLERGFAFWGLGSDFGGAQWSARPDSALALTSNPKPYKLGPPLLDSHEGA